MSLKTSLMLLVAVVLTGCMDQPGPVADEDAAGEAHTEPGLCVLFLLDVSHSVPATLRTSMVEYINRAATLRRRETDRAGVIVFGREAATAIPPIDEDIQLPPHLESPVDGSATDLAAAIRRAARSFPPDFQKRMVIITDGNQTRSDALREAGSAVAAGVGIDVVPIPYHHRRDVVVERLAAPGEVRRGQPFDLQVVVSSVTSDDSGQVAGRLVITRAAGFRSEVVGDQRVAMPSGEKIFAVRHEIQRPGFYQYEARFVPDRLEDDGVPQNNRATAFINVPGKGQALLIENHEDKGRHDRLVDAVRRQAVDLTVRPSDSPFSTLAQLLAFDTVILADVPRDHFTDDQIKVLVANTQLMGRTVAYTSDASTRWNQEWLDWEDYDKFFDQIVRWSMRPAAGTRKFAAGLEVDGEQIHVRVSGIDKSQASLSSLSLTAIAVGPDLQPVTVKMEQTDPGEYMGGFAARDVGDYFVMITPGDGQVPIRAAVNLPESDELRDRKANRELLETLAAMKPEGGAAGKIIEGQTGSLDELITVNPFRDLGSQ